MKQENRMTKTKLPTVSLQENKRHFFYPNISGYFSLFVAVVFVNLRIKIEYAYVFSFELFEVLSQAICDSQTKHRHAMRAEPMTFCFTIW